MGERAAKKPVAWMFPREHGWGLYFNKPADFQDEAGNWVRARPLYTSASPQAQELTDEQILEIAAKAWSVGKVQVLSATGLDVDELALDLARALLEARHA